MSFAVEGGQKSNCRLANRRFNFKVGQSTETSVACKLLSHLLRATWPKG